MEPTCTWVLNLAKFRSILTLMMENSMERKMGHEMEAANIQWFIGFKFPEIRP